MKDNFFDEETVETQYLDGKYTHHLTEGLRIFKPRQKEGIFHNAPIRIVLVFFARLAKYSWIDICKVLNINRKTAKKDFDKGCLLFTDVNKNNL